MPIHNFSFTYLEYRDDGGYSAKLMQILEEEIMKICRQDKYQVYGLTHEDLAQELRFHIWVKLPLYNPQKSSIKTWAYKVINNRIKNLKRDSNALKRKANNNMVYITGDEERTEHTIRQSH